MQAGHFSADVRSGVVVTILKLDRDDGRAFPLWRLWWVLRLMGWRAEWIEYVRSRRGWHCLIAVPGRVSPVEVVAVQAVMGSDRNREAFNLARARKVQGTRRVPGLSKWRWNVLFERKLRTGGER